MPWLLFTPGKDPVPIAQEAGYLHTVDSFNLVAMGLNKHWIIFSHPKHFSIHLIQIQSPRTWRQNVRPKHWNLNIALHVVKTQNTKVTNTQYENLKTYIKGC
jgi:hypothetical protein